MATIIVPLLTSKFQILKKTAASLGFTQFITSWAITICGLITYPYSLSDPHATMCIALALLGKASHATSFWFGEPHANQASSRLRVRLCLAHSFILYFGFAFKYGDHNEDKPLYETFVLISLIQNLVWDSLSLGFFSWREYLEFEAFGYAFATFVVTILYIIIVLWLRFGLADCNMNTGDDNQWTFGQYLALFVLRAPIYSTLEAFLGI